MALPSHGVCAVMSRLSWWKGRYYRQFEYMGLLHLSKVPNEGHVYLANHEEIWGSWEVATGLRLCPPRSNLPHSRFLLISNF